MERNSNGVAWLGLLIAILALILAWSAYNRAGENLENQANDVLDEVMLEIDETANQAEQEMASEELPLQEEQEDEILE